MTLHEQISQHDIVEGQTSIRVLQWRWGTTARIVDPQGWNVRMSSSHRDAGGDVGTQRTCAIFAPPTRLDFLFPHNTTAAITVTCSSLRQLLT